MIRAESVDRDEDDVPALQVDVGALLGAAACAARPFVERIAVAQRLGRREDRSELDDAREDGRAVQVDEADVVGAGEPSRGRRRRRGCGCEEEEGSDDPGEPS